MAEASGVWAAAGSTARLCAVVEAPRGVAASEVVARLDRAAGLLRRELAQAISRKRTPTLTFRVVPADSGAAEEPQ